MRTLLDECIPRNFKNYLAKNGELPSRAEVAGFQAFPTIDRRLEYQQNLESRGIAVVFNEATSSRLADSLPQVSETLKVLPSIKPGELAKVGFGGFL